MVLHSFALTYCWYYNVSHFSFFYRNILCITIDPCITFEELCTDMRDICNFSPEQVFTMKWVDEEGK